MNICNYKYVYIYISHTQLCVYVAVKAVFSAEETSVFAMFLLQDIAV